MNLPNSTIALPKADKFYVYLLQSQRTRRFNLGHTQDLEERLAHHTRGGSPSTRGRGPWALVYWEEYETRVEAMRREQELKRKKSHAYLQRLVSASR